MLGASIAGSFCVRPSSQANRLALSHAKGNGVVGHAIINVHGEDNTTMGVDVDGAPAKVSRLADS